MSERAGDVEVRQTVIHGVECHEAWRESTDCPHEQAPADRPSWAICDRCKVGDHDGCTVLEANEECCCGA